LIGIGEGWIKPGQEQASQTAYDQVPYPSLSYSPSHPDRLATMGTLLGMSPPPVDRCRVLELGCAGGGNLIPMAYGLPHSEFVGIDSSLRQIAEGQALLEALELQNIVLQHLDILDVDQDLGQFDYIIAHGLFSWVPPEVREKILQICKHHLSPDGIAYVSYNTYPGWHMINIVRGLMLYRVRDVTDPFDRVEQARDVLRLMAELHLDKTDAYGSFLSMYADFLGGKLEEARPRSDALLLHDELEEVNEPIYFYQFAERAARHGLQYLADFHHLRGGELPREVSQALERMSKNIIDLEQYLDFLQNRTFRQTLLCHEDVTINRNLTPDCARAFYAASRAQPVAAEPDIHSVSVEHFRGQDGATLSIDHPVTKAAMFCLAEAWPRAMSFDELLSAARARLSSPGGRGGNGDLDAQMLGANLLTAYGYSDSLVELHVHAPPMATKAGERPVASHLARLQAQSVDRVTNLRHERVTLDGFDRYLLSYLDGSHGRAAIVDLLLAGPVAEGVLTFKDAAQPLGGSDQARDLLAEELECRLAWLARAALLIE
jgi:methyltransferase-like protein/2-polyprenyl-3-methyl-5-hydroxy-6-metoxy-1,4-benzoquinol methylase